MLYISTGGAEQVQWTERLGWDLKGPALTAQKKSFMLKGVRVNLPDWIAEVVQLFILEE